MPHAARLAKWSPGHNYSTTNSVAANTSITVTRATGATFDSGAGFTALATGSSVFTWEAQNSR